MRKLFASIILSCLFAIPCFAMDWIPTNSSVVTWSPVTDLVNGADIPDGDTISYNVFVALEADIAKTNPILKAATTENTATITFSINDIESKYYVGLQTVRLVNGVDVTKSRIGWSDEPEIVYEGKVFGLSYFVAPDVATGLRVN